MTQISSVISHAEDWPTIVCGAIWLIAYCISWATGGIASWCCWAIVAAVIVCTLIIRQGAAEAAGVPPPSAAVKDQPATRDKFRVLPALLCPGWDRTRA